MSKDCAIFQKQTKKVLPRGTKSAIISMGAIHITPMLLDN